VTSHPVIHIVDGDEEHVGPTPILGRPGSTVNATDEKQLRHDMKTNGSMHQEIHGSITLFKNNRMMASLARLIHQFVATGFGDRYCT